MPKIFISKDELDHYTLYILFNYVGEPNGIFRRDLVERVFDVNLRDDELTDANPFDRQVRQSIERLRHQGHIICNTGNGMGYYMAATLEEYQAFRASYGSHAFPVMEAIRDRLESPHAALVR